MTTPAHEPLPGDFQPFGHVVGRAIRAVGDTIDDSDADPEAIPIVGTGLVRFSPVQISRVVTSTAPTTLVAEEAIDADLDNQGILCLSGHQGVTLWPGIWAVTAPKPSTLAFPAFQVEITSAHTADAPLQLWSVAPWTPGPGQTAYTLTVPSGAAAGQVLGWDGSRLAWTDGDSGGPSGQGPQGVGVASITDTDGDGVATVTLHDPRTGTDTTSALPLPRGLDGHTPVLSWSGTALAVDGVTGPDLKGTPGTSAATPAFTATATTLPAGSAATASIGGSYPNLVLGLGIPRGADGDGSGGGGGGSTQIVGAGRPDIASTMDTGVQAAVAAAPVGHTFISTDTPQGAAVWRRMPSGWVCIDGDTGWCDITDQTNHPDMQLRISRVGHTVTHTGWADSVTSGDRVRIQLPPGFIPTIAACPGIHDIYNYEGIAVGFNNFRDNAGDVRVQFAGEDTLVVFLDTGRHSYATWTSTDPWPTTLPPAAA